MDWFSVYVTIFALSWLNPKMLNQVFWFIQLPPSELDHR